MGPGSKRVQSRHLDENRPTAFQTPHLQSLHALQPEIHPIDSLLSLCVEPNGSQANLNLAYYLELDHLRTTFRAPRADNRMDTSPTQAGYIKRAAEWIRFRVVTQFGRVIFNHHYSVHDKS
jgi:hypothetical protein